MVSPKQLEQKKTIRMNEEILEIYLFIVRPLPCCFCGKIVSSTSANVARKWGLRKRLASPINTSMRLTYSLIDGPIVFKKKQPNVFRIFKIWKILLHKIVDYIDQETWDNQ